jgi:hypothetical protein
MVLGISVLAVLIVVFTAPLLADLALCIAGNLADPRAPRGHAKRTVRLAVVVPAHNEAQLIARTVDSVRAADAETQVFVVAHNCTDKTAKAAAVAGATVLELNDPKLRGKGAALRHGFQAALASGADAIMVIDADSVASSNLIAATRAAIAAGAEATQCRYALALPVSASPMSRLRSIAFLGMNVLRARGRAGLGFSTGLFGNGFAVTAATLERVPFLADSIAEDVEYHTRLVAAGVRVHWVGDGSVCALLTIGGTAQATQEARWEGGRLSVASRCTRRLLAAIASGNWRAAETLADVWSLPLSRGIVALGLAWALPCHWLHFYAAAGSVIVPCYVLEAALMGAEPWRDLAALAGAPVYILWKAAITPLVLRQSRSGAAWVRTSREAARP